MGWEFCWLVGCVGAVRFSVSPFDPRPGPFSGPSSLLPLPSLAGLCPRLPTHFPCLGGTGIRSMSRLSFAVLHLSPPPVVPLHFSVSIQVTSSLASVFSHSFLSDMIAFCFSKIAALEVSSKGKHIHTWGLKGQETFLA